MSLSTYTDFFAYTDWANQKLLGLAVELGDEALDRSFEMGPGSIRQTLQHTWAAERVWFDRWVDPATARFVASEPGVRVAELIERSRRLAGEREAFLAREKPENIDRAISFSDSKGKPYTFSLRGLMLHVCTHSVHHRAQAINMLRRVGAGPVKPGSDYIFMKIEQGDAVPPPALDVRAVRDFYAYVDWARDRLHTAAADLSDEQLDRPFEMGVGTLRKTLGHIRDGERWWLANWNGQGGLFPAADEREPLASIRESFAAVARERDALLAGMTDRDLQRVVEAVPRPGVVRRFPIGVTMLQLCCHGTHHRSQAVNMLRHLGGALPRVDVLARLLEKTGDS